MSTTNTRLRGSALTSVGAMFVLGGALWLIAGVVRQELQFQARWDLLGVIGGAFILYGLAVHPVIGMFGSHFFPAAPVFGLAPCPSAIFTVGLLLWTRRRVPMYVLVVPLVWFYWRRPPLRPWPWGLSRTSAGQSSA